MIILIYGNYLKNNLKFQQLIQEFKDFDIINYDYSQVDLKFLNQELNTESLFENQKVIVLRNIDFESIDLDKFINNPSSNNLIIIEDSFKIENSKIFTSLKNNNYKIYKNNDFIPLEIKESFIKLLNENHITYQNSTIDYLFSKSKDLNYLYNEIDKLINYSLEKKTISKEDIDNVLFIEYEDSIYELTNIILKNDKEKILKIYNDLIFMNQDINFIFSSIYFKLIEVLKVKLYLDYGFDDNYIINNLKISKGKLYYLKQNIKISYERFKFLLDLISLYDFKIKIGLIDKKNAIDVFMLKV